MKSVQDALYNWLTIKVVYNARPEDMAAKETEEMFMDILETEHRIKDITIDHDETFYNVSYCKEGKKHQMRFPTELIEGMINQINESPEKFQNYPL